MTPRHTFPSVLTTAGAVSVIATCFFIPLSTSLMGIFSVLALFFWLVSGKAVQLPRHMAENPVVFLSTVLFILFVIGLTYSPVPLSDGVKILAKYRELLFIPVVIILLSQNENGCRMAENSFITGCIVLLVISYALYFSLIPPVRYGNSIIHHITHSFFMALLSFWAIQRTIDSKQYRYFWLVVYLAAVINIAYINPGRAGMVTFVVLMVLTVFQRLSWGKIVIALLVFAGLLTGAYYGSENVSTRTKQAVWEIRNYAPEKSRTSLGMRFDWWHNSIDLIKEAPVFGHGTGSFATVQKEIKGKRTRPSDNPHNEYLFIGVQVGMLGMAAWILLLATQFAVSFRMAPQKKYIVQGIVTAMAFGCLANSFLFDSHQGHFYAFLSAIFFAAEPGRPNLRL